MAASFRRKTYGVPPNGFYQDSGSSHVYSSYGLNGSSGGSMSPSSRLASPQSSSPQGYLSSSPTTSNYGGYRDNSPNGFERYSDDDQAILAKLEREGRVPSADKFRRMICNVRKVSNFKTQFSPSQQMRI
jgi:hypothetical protein